MAWEWDMQETTRAAVWYGKLPAERRVVDTYRVCRPGFKAVLDQISRADDQASFRRQIEADHAGRVTFARRMIELGNAHEQ